MADFSSADLVTAAKTRFGESVLRNRMRGASGTTAQDLELTKIAGGVIGRVRDAAVQVGWPLPGNWPAGSVDDDDSDIGGTPYSEIWPKNLLQKALDIFNWRTVSGLDATSESQRKVGLDAERWFDSVEAGGNSLGVGGSADTARPVPVSARNRAGEALTTECGETRENTLDTFRGFGWDQF